MSNWYVTNDGAGSEDGTFGNAWAIDGIVWGEGGVVAGDTLYVDGILYGRVVVGASGEAGNRISIRFNPGAQLWPTTDVSDAWTLVSGEVFKRTVSSQNALLWEDGVLLHAKAHYTDSEGTIAAALERGEFTVKQTPMTLYVRCNDGESPSTHVMRANDRALDGENGAFEVASKNYIDVYNLNVRGVYWTGGLQCGFSVIDGESVRFFNPEVYESWRICNIDGGDDHAVLDGNCRDIIGTGYFIEAGSADLNNFVIRRCVLNRVGREPRYNGIDRDFSMDCDGIGVGGDGGNINNLIIEDNVLIDCGPNYTSTADYQSAYPSGTGDINRGSGIFVGTANSMDVTGLKIRRNRVIGGHRYGLYVGEEVSGEVLIESNMSIGCGNYANLGYSINRCIGTENVGASWTVRNNTVIGGTARSSWHFKNMTASDTLTIKANVFYQNEKVDHVDALSWYGDYWFEGSVTPSLDSDLNAFGDRSALATSAVVRNLSNTYTTLAAWTAAASEDANSIDGDVGVRSDGRLDGGSPCIGANLDASGEAVIGLDGLRFMSPSSMGAYEVRTKSGYARTAGAMPARVLPAGVDIAKARAA